MEQLQDSAMYRQVQWYTIYMKSFSACSHYIGQTTSGAHFQAPILGVSTYNTCTSVFCRYMYQQFANFKIFISLNQCRSSARKVLHQMIQSVMSLIINITTYTFISSSCIQRCKTQAIQQANQYVFGLWDKYINTLAHLHHNGFAQPHCL